MTDQSESSPYITADEAARWLGVSRATLYAYVSRGLLRSEPIPGSKARRYVRSDVEGLASRGRGAGPKASPSALSFGEPLLESRLSLIQDGRLSYRGYESSNLARDRTFEDVATLLWWEEFRSDGWPTAGELAGDAARVRQVVGSLAMAGSSIERAMSGLMALGIGDLARFGVMREQVARFGGRIVRLVAALMADESRVDACLGANSTAEACLLAFSESPPPVRGAELAAMNAALILCADHDLNASTFTARVTASTGANLYAVTTAALAALSGPKHGGVSDRIEAILREVDREARTPEEASVAFAARLGRGDFVWGYNHPLYPAGDPRFPALRSACDGLRLSPAARKTIAKLDAINDAARRLGLGEPTLDMGLVSIRVALGLAPGSASAIFAVGRTAGWIAHALEQSGSSQILRPRARYVGPPVRANPIVE